MTGIVCILFICSLPVSSFAAGGSYTSNQLGSSTAELNFYKINDFYSSTVTQYSGNYRNYGYINDTFEYLALSSGGTFTAYNLWGIGSTMQHVFDDYVYIYYPGCLTMLNINSDIVTYQIVSSTYYTSNFIYYTLGFGWVSSGSYSFDTMIRSNYTHSGSNVGDYYQDTTFNGNNRRIYSSPILKPGIVYDYNSSQWVSGHGSTSGDLVIQPYGVNGIIHAYDSLYGHFHYVDILTIQTPISNSLSGLFDNFTSLNYDIADYTSVFCPGLDIDSCIWSWGSNEKDNNSAANFPWIFASNSNYTRLNPAEYVTDIISNGSGGSITTSEIKNNYATSVPTSNAPYTTKAQTRPGLTTTTSPPFSSSGSGTDNSAVESKLDDIASGIADLTGDITPGESTYSVSSSDTYYDLEVELDSAVAALSSRGNDLSSVCGQAEGFFDSVFDGLPSLMIAAVVCAAICLFIAKVVNR